jgi:hypothetical protein
MSHVRCKWVFSLALAALGWVGQGDEGRLMTAAHAVVGAAATPVSYAGVARRSTVGAGAPGAGVRPGPGVGAPGAGARPGVGVGAPGVGAAPANRGGPVNRAGVR